MPKFRIVRDIEGEPAAPMPIHYEIQIFLLVVAESLRVGGWDGGSAEEMGDWLRQAEDRVEDGWSGYDRNSVLMAALHLIATICDDFPEWGKNKYEAYLQTFKACYDEEREDLRASGAPLPPAPIMPGTD